MPAFEVDGDQRRAGLQVGVLVGEAEVGGDARQQLELLRRPGAQLLRRGEAVDQQRIAARRVGHQAMQQLHAGRRVAIGIVAVHAKAERRVGEVVRVRHRDDVEQLAVIGGAHEAEAITDLRHHARPHRHVAQQAEAVRVIGLQPAQLSFRIARHCGPVALRQVCKIGAPQPDRRGRRGLQVVLVQERGEVGGDVLLLLPRHAHAAVGLHRDALDLRLFRQIARSRTGAGRSGGGIADRGTDRAARWRARSWWCRRSRWRPARPSPVPPARCACNQLQGSE